jgi:pimeloyl-ACP methyl ester carboxylesterase
MRRADATAYGASRRLPRRTAIVDGGRVRYVVVGSGSPPIVFLSGAGMDLDSWFKVLPAAGVIGTAFAYDRPGTGTSDRPATAQTGAVVVETLRTVLDQAGLAPPYVLVGHSIGGLHVELFARCHPDDVTGVVLVEAASPAEAADPPRRGVMARALDGLATAFDRLRGRLDGLGEVDVIDQTLDQIRAAPPFPDVPLVVVSGGRRMRFVPPAAFEAHQAAQRERVGLSPGGRQVIAPASGHFPQLHDPDIVVAAIRDVAG